MLYLKSIKKSSKTEKLRTIHTRKLIKIPHCPIKTVKRAGGGGGEYALRYVFALKIRHAWTLFTFFIVYRWSLLSIAFKNAMLRYSIHQDLACKRRIRTAFSTGTISKDFSHTKGRNRRKNVLLNSIAQNSLSASKHVKTCAVTCRG